MAGFSLGVCVPVCACVCVKTKRSAASSHHPGFLLHKHSQSPGATAQLETQGRGTVRPAPAVYTAEPPCSSCPGPNEMFI